MSNELDQYTWGVSAGWGRLDDDAKVKVGFALLDLAADAIANAGVPQHRVALGGYINQLEAMLNEARQIKGRLDADRDAYRARRDAQLQVAEQSYR
jgi:hypothetical protein